MSELTRHATASVFVIRRLQEDVELLLLWHQKLRHWMIPGGHVEANEDPAQAAVREVMEETGLKIQLENGAATPEVGNFEDTELVPVPAWIAVEDIPAHKTEPAHQHIDFLYIAEPVEQFGPLPDFTRWFPMSALPEAEMFPATARFALFIAKTSLAPRLDGCDVTHPIGNIG